MNVIRHYHPGQETIEFTVEVPEGSFNESRDTRVPEVASAVARIHQPLQSLSSPRIIPLPRRWLQFGQPL